MTEQQPTLGQRLRAIRARIVASGERLIGWEELEREKAQRREGDGNVTMVRNRPTEQGRALGVELARLTQVEIDRLAAEGTILTPCRTCAFRAGTIPNGCPATVMNALKCVMEREPFYCHETRGNEELCQGYAASVSEREGTPDIECPWDYVEGQ